MAYLGFDRRIRLDWLDATAGLMLRNPDPAAVRAGLHQSLAEAIPGTEARVKTITLLSRMWVSPPLAPHLRDEALRLMPTLLPADRLWLHWGLSLLAFPFFRDVAATVGRLIQIQGTCTVGQVTDRMISVWGERSTLVRATQRALRSLVAWEVLAEQAARGSFAACPVRTTEPTALQVWLLDAALRAHQNEGVALAELLQLPELFPFNVTLTRYDLARLDRFELLVQGSGVDLVYPASALRSASEQ
jgi:hypothetical protein